jgi:hypothetical protein
MLKQMGCMCLISALKPCKLAQAAEVRREALTVTERQRIPGRDIGNLSATAFAPVLWCPFALRTDGTNGQFKVWARAAPERRPTAPLCGAPAKSKMSNMSHLDKFNWGEGLPVDTHVC